uniref:calcium-binding protein n=1 Tax=Methylibium rhizosphaerae TaxID=2570323 RepID=UPI00248270C9
LGTNADTIVLGAGITPADVTLTRWYDDLVISINGTDDRLTVPGYFYNDGTSVYAVEAIRFADGTSWNYATTKSKVSTATTPAGATFNGTASADSVVGTQGNDTLRGDAGNDTLDGGAGNDTLDGGTGNDTYLFGRGSGKDTINSYDTTAGKLDVVQLGAGITAADVVLTRSGDELVLS